jgi:uridine kinase
VPTAADEIDVAAIVELALQRPASCGRTRVVCVDGPAGSGKTTLAGRLDGAFRHLRDVTERSPEIATLHMDDLYEDWEGLGPDLEPRLLAQVLIPLAAQRPGRWQQYDWHAGGFGPWRDLPVPDVLVIEGCGSGAQAYDAFRALLVWVEAEPAVRMARGVDRDGEQVIPQWIAWTEREDAHFRVNETRRRADVRIRTG